MLSGTDVIKGKRQEIWLNANNQPSLSAFVHKVDQDTFWTNLPRCSGQVLMLQVGQSVEVGVSLAEGFYNATTHLSKVGNTSENFYGFEMPLQFVKTQERKFLRIPYAASVLFRTDEMATTSASINFSAGGIMVFLVPELEKMINTGKDITMTINMENESIILPMQFSWKKTYDQIPMAGFGFQDIDPALQDKFTVMVEKCSRKDAGL